ncbi:hypothetical protein GGX14DRAFT_402497 [Mycena pura]|uniref:Ribonuclease H1 N-terminal domain-containing protein n=1 Tax=Mycena pura TaxID=153505 RepID=A0AAD6Y5F6_9AGAR|nr:hypothetical protein GGX14DRAFT_402497 [Mycena pura]
MLIDDGRAAPVLGEVFCAGVRALVAENDLHTAVRIIGKCLTDSDLLDDISDEGFYPRVGFEGKRGSVDFTFYVVERGYCPGIYTHWEDACRQVSGFKNCCHKKYTGWDAAVAALDNSRHPMTPPHILSPPITPPQPRAEVDSRHSSQSKNSKRIAQAPATASGPKTRDALCQPAHQLATPGSESSVPATSARAKKLLYVYSGGDASTIYTDEQMASTVARRGLEEVLDSHENMP